MADDLSRTVYEMIRDFSLWAYEKARIYWLSLLTLSVFISLVMQTYSAYYSQASREIIVYTTFSGGSTARMGKLVAKEIDALEVPWLTYHSQIVPSQGYDDVAERIAADKNGRQVGFIQDRPDDTKSLRVLLPVSWDFMHVICSRKFLGDLVEQNKLPVNNSKPIQLSDISQHLSKKNSVYLGPPESGTHRLAKEVLARVKIRDPDRLSAFGIYDWKDVRAALNKNHVDLVFYMGPLDSQIVKEIAGDGSSVLLSLDHVQSAIIENQPGTWPFSFPENQYVTPNDASEQTYETKTKPEEMFSDLPFCPANTKTFSSRRVFVASQAMSNSDAYAISIAAKKALSQDYIAGIDPWNELPPGVTPDKQQPVKLSLQPHSGVQEDPNAAPPWIQREYWSPFSQNVFHYFIVLCGPVLLIACSEFLNMLTQRLSQPSQKNAPAGDEHADGLSSQKSPTSLVDAANREESDKSAALAAANPSNHRAYHQLSRILGHISDTIEQQSPPISSASKAGWENELEHLKTMVQNDYNSKRLTPEEQANLLDEIEREFAFLSFIDVAEPAVP